MVCAIRQTASQAGSQSVSETTPASQRKSVCVQYLADSFLTDNDELSFAPEGIQRFRTLCDWWSERQQQGTIFRNDDDAGVRACVHMHTCVKR